ncbi:hypothetical protein BDQ12DRAFT_669257 [Crucibulum laeve]|uniref:Transmembrane protein n=1 Tax=Crucibulum laeve TaxID=68775 RepID=A0A5C3LND0_9AGAR|nr:hypothetical protein BDQ12DRAFT_669257 [Crucibulum laeve]
MRSFASISLLAAAVCATFVAAAPAPPAFPAPPAPPAGGLLGGLGLRAEPATPPAGGSPFGDILGGLGLRQVPALPELGSLVPGLDATKAGLGAVSPGSAPPRRRTETRSLPAILIDTCSKLHVVVDKITNAFIAAIISVKADINIDVVVQLIGDIKLILAEAVVEVKFLVAHPIDGLCELNGKVFSVYEIAQLVAAIYTLVIACLASVTAVVGVEVKIIVSLIAEIDVILAEFLATLLLLVGGLLSALIPLIKCVLGLIHSLHLEACLKVLGYP